MVLSLRSHWFKGLQNLPQASDFQARIASSKYTHVGCVPFAGFLLFWATVARARQQLKVLGDSIRQYRTQAGLSQEKLAERADLHPVYIGKIERGEQWISLHALLRVAAALGVRARDLIHDL
jgi:DNA-binding XRE family transcriptional regulator